MNKFSKPPLTQKEKEKKAREFLNFAEFIDNKNNYCKNLNKEPMKVLYLRAPESYWKDIKEITILTGLSMNAVCLELLRSVIKKKLREIKNDML
jgi:hypothetical protein